MTADTLLAAALPKTPSMNRLIVAATIGNVFEWFDFVVYGFFAVTLAEVFFPAGNPTVSLLVTFGAFGLAYFVRPLGAIVIGADDDWHDTDGGDAGLCDNRLSRADRDHYRAAVAGIFGRWRIRQCRQLPGRAWRRAPRVQRQLAVCHWRTHHGYGFTVWRRPDVVVDP